ncbi:MAG: sulfatase-like hydrolase/transferase [Verrucomicrobiales bacterium]|nr:sulfatase-like hydrolase/transferase [Verrucomicrobiales bacterium]
MKALILTLALACSLTFAGENPHIILVMSDDQGWGQTGYQGHPDIKTPHLDEMAANGLRFNRFYAGASTCSPSRATVLTGRSNDRTGVYTHGAPLRLQEKTIAQALAKAGYATGHFGKWHLDGLRGPGVPVLETDTHSPGAFGFEHWLTVTNYFDIDPLMGRMGEFEEFKGDSSEVAVAEALKFIEEKAKEQPTFTVIWYGTPHDPMVASGEDRAPFSHLSERAQNQYGEILAMDRSIGTLRSTLRDLEIADNTLIWFCSDNGGLKDVGEGTMGGLRESKGTMYEGGLRVPGIIEWPAQITEGMITEFPAGTVDIFPTVAEIVGLPEEARLQPQDGQSILPVIRGEKVKRAAALPFRHNDRGVLIRERFKLLFQGGKYELYNLVKDPAETTNLIESNLKIAKSMKSQWAKWNATVEASDAGADYPEGSVTPDQPERRFWYEDESYDSYIEQFKSRPEYSDWLKKHERHLKK